MAKTDWVALVRELGSQLAARAAEHDAQDAFVAENYALLAKHRVFSAGVPAELGGGGASHGELCALLRELAHHCASTALAFSMHTHVCATMVWRFKHADNFVEPLLRRVAAEELVLVSSGGSDWVEGSGKAERVDGGYRINARKVFASGSPCGKLLITMAVYDDPQAGPQVLHFPMPIGEGVKSLDTWHTLGMRGTGSHDLLIENVFVPDSAIGLRRPAGKWHRFWDVITPVVWPLIMSVYVGVAEAARAIALEQARRRREDVLTQMTVGEMDTQLAAAQLALDGMIRLGADYAFEPDAARSNQVFMYKTTAARASIAAVEKAMEVSGGAGFFRKLGLERLFRDIQGVRYHPWQEKKQYIFSGRIALGLEPV